MNNLDLIVGYENLSSLSAFQRRYVQYFLDEITSHKGFKSFLRDFCVNDGEYEEGCFSKVFSHNEWAFAVKIFNPNDYGYLTFLNYTLMNQDKSCFPKIFFWKHGFDFFGKSYDLVIMEKLYEAGFTFEEENRWNRLWNLLKRTKKSKTQQYPNEKEFL